MLISILYPYLRFTIGTLYPSYKSWKSLKRKDETTRRRWMKYWVSFGAFQLFELFADVTLFYLLPFYYYFKLLALLWLVAGTTLIFDSIVNRELAKRETYIDKWLTRILKARNEVIALIWQEISRGSVRIVTASVSAIVSKDEQNNDSNTNTNSNNNNNVNINNNNNESPIPIDID